MEYDLKYNSELTKLIIPEYGRHIQKLVEHCMTLEDKAARNKLAQAIIDVMGNQQPHLRDVPDFKHKLWDQLFIMSDFKLDVDSPFPVTTKEELKEKPERLPYPKVASKYRYYGYNMQTMIDVAIAWKDDETKGKLVYAIANHMKKCYLIWNKDSVTDAIIKKHLIDLSDNKLDIDVEKTALKEDSIITAGQKKRYNQNNKQKKKKYKRR
jgi:hypothetical protein